MSKLPFDNSALLHQINADVVLKETIANVEAYLGIGVANKRWIAMIYEGSRYETTDGNRAWRSYSNEGAIDDEMGFAIPVPLVIGSKNLYITQTQIGINDADEGDELDRLRWYGYSAYDTETNFLDTGAGLDEDTPSDYTWDHADTQIGGVYKRIILSMKFIGTNAFDFDVYYVLVEYYYA